jgi:hypothetical protein
LKIYGLVEKIKAFIGNWQSAAPTLASGESSHYFDTDGDPRVIIGAAGADTDLAIPTSTQKTSFSASGDVSLTLPTSGTLETTSGSASAASSAVSSHSALATGVHGVGTGDVVGTDKVQTLTEKYLNGGTANSNNKWKVPQDTLANIQLLTPTEGLIVYATDVDTVYVGDGSSWLPVGSGSGQGEKNYIENPSATTATTGWAASSANITIARTTTAANCPREFTTGTALSFTSSTDEAYGYYRFSLDDCDLSKKLKLLLSFINADTSDAWRVEMWKNSASNYSGTYTELSLSTDSSGDSYLPVTTGDYKTTFDTDTTAYLEIRIVHNGTNSDVLYVSDVIVGPGSVVTGAVVEEWKSYTPDVEGNGSKVTTSLVGKYRRVGDSLKGRISWQLNSTASGGGGATVRFSLPAGLTADSTKIPASGADSIVGVFTDYAAVNAAQFTNAGEVYVSSSTLLGMVKAGTANIYTTDDLNVARAIQFQIEFEVPIAEWAGSGTVNILNDSKQSPMKAGLIQAWPGTTAAVPRGWFLCDGSEKAITDYPELYASIGTTWNTAVNPITGSAQAAPSAGNFRVPNLQGTFLRGVGDFSDNTKDTTLAGFQADQMQGHEHNVTLAHGTGQTFPSAYGSVTAAGGTAGGTPANYGDFGTVTSPADDGTNGTPRTGTETRPQNVGVYYIIKAFNDSWDTVGFGMHKPGVSAGLVPAQGLDGRTDGVAVPAGKVGEKITWTTPPSTQNTTTSVADWTNANLVLTPGVWLVQASVTAGYTTGTTAGSSGYTRVLITDTSNNIVQEMDKSASSQTAAAASSRITTALPFSFIANVSSNTTYKLRVAHVDSAGSGSGFVGNEGVLRSQFFAVRIA